MLRKGRQLLGTSGTRRGYLVTKPVISHERSGSVYDKWKISWSFVTQIFHSGQPRHGGDRTTFEVIDAHEMLLHEIMY